MKLNIYETIQRMKISRTQTAFQNLPFSMNIVFPRAAESRNPALPLASLNPLNVKPELYIDISITNDCVVMSF